MCFSSNNKKFDALEQVLKILAPNEYDSFPVKLQLFNYLPIHNEKEIPIKFHNQNFSQCINYPNLKIEPKDVHAFEKNPWTRSFTQEVVTYDQNLCINNSLFNSFFDNQNIEHDIGKTDKLSLIHC